MALASFTKTWHNTTYDAISPRRPELSANGKTVVISGGGAGIGARIAESFAAAAAANVIILGRTEKTLAANKGTIEKSYPSTKVFYHIADVADAAAVDKAFDKIVEAHGHVDVLVANAGYLPDIGPIKTAEINDWMRGFDVNVRGSLNLAQAFLRAASKNATVINVSSGVAHLGPMSGHSAYAASKLGATKLWDYVQAENPEINVIHLSPGIIESDMQQKSFNSEGGIGKMGLPLDDISLPADFTVWLASPEGTWLNNKFVWANWDVDEMKAKKEEITKSDLITVGLAGWPFSG